MSLALLCTAAAVAGGAEFGYQLHSYNDMRQWPVLAAKAKLEPGFMRLKLDPHYVVNEKFCKRHGFPGSHCFVLNHDDPDMNETYNTSLELVDAMSVFSGGYLALCVKFSGLACLDVPFIELMDSMFKELTPSAQKHNITLILDGSATPTERFCFEDRFQPWTSTWIPGRDPEEAAVSDSGYYKRYQVLNMNCCANVVQKMKDLSPSFGKFAALSTPFQLWEPSDEKTIRSVRDGFIAANISHELLFAINQDQMALLNYVASTPQTTTTLSHTVHCTHHTTSYIAETQSLLTEGTFFNLHSKLAGLQCSTHGVIAITEDGVVRSITNGAATVLRRLRAPVESAFHLESVNVTVSSNGSWVFGETAAGSVLMGVGSGLSALPTAAATDRFLFTLTNGYCFNCEKFNKRPTPRMCDQVPTPQANVMSYTLTTPAALLEQLQNGTGGIGHWAPYILHSCNDKALHGSFGIGEDPKVYNTAGRVTVSYQALSVVNSTTCPATMCGCPEPYTGTERMTFHLPFEM